jgi:uncharacterized protein (DUF1499 family)
MWKRLMWIAGIAIGIVLGLAVVLLAGLALWSWQRPDNLGVNDGKLAPCPDSPNCVSTQAADHEHRIEPLRFDDAPDLAWARLVRLVSGLPRTNVVDAGVDYMHVEFASLLFRFVDDVEFWMDTENKVIHFRSASRVGRGDLGANRSRMEAIRKAWQTAK